MIKVLRNGLPMLAVTLLAFGLQAYLGQEISLFPLYLLPIVYLAWELGWAAAVIASVGAAALWYWGNVLSGDQLSHEWIRLFNAVVRGLVFASMGCMVAMYRRTLDAHRSRLEAMRSLLEVCHGCGAIHRADGSWIPVADLVRHFALPQPPAECPECARSVARVRAP